MVSFPFSKINLGLNILRKRLDGFHDLETCFYPIPWTDILEIIAAEEFAFTSSGLIISSDVASNLCVKAYHLIKKDFDVPPVKIHLHKIIPMGAGLGGGSSDAAFTLLQLNESFSLGLDTQALQRYAAILGSDCAFFITSQPMMGTGRGEVLTPATVSLKGKYLVVIKPEIHVSTAEAFAGITPGESEMKIADVVQKPLTEWRGLLKNDFEQSIFKRYPAISRIKDQLYDRGALYSSMSGSGSSVYGIFDHEIDLSKSFPGSSFWSGKL